MRGDNGRGEFEQFPLAVGVVRGVRTFRLIDNTVLAGISYPQFWRPGENRAVCYAGYWFTQQAEESDQIEIRIPPLPSIDPATIPPHPIFDPALAPTHTNPRQYADCSCGFYAYFGFRTYLDNSGISGVVEGYGRTVIGTSGFRASLARIVALAMPRVTPLGGGCPCPLCAIRERVAPEVIRASLGRYGVPVFDTGDAMLREFPTDDPPPQPSADDPGEEESTSPAAWTPRYWPLPRRS